LYASRCPFHGWAFDKDGICQSIPYSDGDIPANANTRSYTVDETHHVILLWFDAEGRPPTWRLADAWPQIPANYTYEGKAIHHIGCHISEVPENGADVAHLNILHESVHPIGKAFPVKSNF
jgi:cholesterol 7-dehydrogenase